MSYVSVIFLCLSQHIFWASIQPWPDRPLKCGSGRHTEGLYTPVVNRNFFKQNKTKTSWSHCNLPDRQQIYTVKTCIFFFSIVFAFFAEAKMQTAWLAKWCWHVSGVLTLPHTWCYMLFGINRLSVILFSASANVEPADGAVFQTVWQTFWSRGEFHCSKYELLDCLLELSQEQLHLPKDLYSFFSNHHQDNLT